MLYKRHMEKTLKKAFSMFGAVLVTGARQVGKTTILKESFSEIDYITLDDPFILQSANIESGAFFKDHQPPIIIDEIQYSPKLFPFMKIIIDKEQVNGLFLLSGSQQFQLMKNVVESLAGRLGILNLCGLSLREIKSIDFSDPFIPNEKFFQARKKQLEEIDNKELWKLIHRGTMPKMQSDINIDWALYYSSYVKTYIERDVRDLAQVGDEIKFLQFMTVIAANSGQLLNISGISREIGVSAPTINRWLSILSASGIIYLLRPYHNNLTKRTIKTPKLYFLDTGLLAYLTKWNTPEVMQTGAMAGIFFETFVISEVIKSYYNAGLLDLPLYFYRDKDQVEIDLLIESEGSLHPIEIKKHADPDKKDIKAFKVLNNLPNIKRGSGGVICLYDKLLTIQENDRVIPIKYL